MSIWKRKPLAQLLSKASESEKGLKRTLTAWSLVALGIGAVIGSGLFVNTVTAIPQSAGPSVTVGFIIAAFGCSLAGLYCAELSPSIIISGSVYTYTYVTMGELLAWIIGWHLILEYAVGAAIIEISLSKYLNNLLVNVPHVNPSSYSLSHSPFQVFTIGAHGIINLSAIFSVVIICLLLIKAAQELAFVNGLIVIVKVSIIIIVFGWHLTNPIIQTPYISASSILTIANGDCHSFGEIKDILIEIGTLFFAFFGFDSVNLVAKETKNF